jgi:tRNA nucleotidyltransferase (CCA-adding enzyme)
MTLPRERDLQHLLSTLHELGASPMIVGGAVRDWVLGYEPKDLDIEVFSIEGSKLEDVLSKHGEIDLVGKSFGIYKLRLGSQTYDISLPRKDSKIQGGQGHKSIFVETSSNLTPLEASLRRDFTINSLFYDPIKETLMDPHGGIDDIKRKLLKHTSEAFVEDPLRALRAVQFSARFNFSLHSSTAKLCQSMYNSGEYKSLSKERIREELNKFLLKGKYHTTSIEVLRDTMWLDMLPELKNLDTVEQDPQWHPEGNVLKHTFHALEALQTLKGFQNLEDKEKLVYCLGVLCHDLGKPETTYREFRQELGREVITSPNHPQKGLKPTEQLLSRLGYGPVAIRRAKLLTLYHMEHLWVRDAKGVKALAAKLSPSNPHSENPKIEESIYGLSLVVEADHSGRPPLPKGMPEKMRDILSIAQKEGCLHHPIKPSIKGKDLLDLGLPPNKAIGKILKLAYEKQISSPSHSELDLKKWISKNFRKLFVENGGPPPLITGEDLKEIKIKPDKEFSNLLNLVYKKQLDGVLKDKEETLQYILNHLKEKKMQKNILAMQ